MISIVAGALIITVLIFTAVAVAMAVIDTIINILIKAVK